MKPYFSVIVPVYRVEEYLPQCVDSLLAQTFDDLEIILVDDGSPDGCGAICDAYAARDGRVRVIHRENGGLARARRTGLDQARAEYVCFVDSDDWVKPAWLDAMHRCIEENGRPDMIAFDLVRDDGSPGQRLAAAPGYYDRARLEREVCPYMLWDRRKPFLAQLIPGYLCTKITRRELLTAHFIDPKDHIPLYEDAAMVYECLYHADSLFVFPEAFYIYRFRDGSLLGRYDPQELQKLKLCRDYLRGHLVRQAPETAPQADAFITSKVLRVMLQECQHGRSLRASARHIAAALEETGLARDLETEGFPLHVRLFMALLRRRACLLALVIYRIRLWVFDHLQGGAGSH